MTELFGKFLDTVGDFIITIINYLIVGVGTVLGWAVSIFPDSPFQGASTKPDMINLGWITWFIPFPTMFAHAMVLAGAVLTYYGIRVLARWIKMVRS